ncbi:MAG TPA: hypothetical protein VH251_09835, partial [Verrucomicrobiae bacterium]|nr:hypothetical protein [Verrucomicrobiae bacterium]
MHARLTIAAILGIAFISALTPAWGQTTLTWSGGAATDWNTAANWTPHQVPTALDHVIINSGTVVVPATGAFNIMDWLGGDLSGAINVASGHVLNIGGNVLLDAALTNSGTINWTNGNVNMAYNVSTAGPIIN